MKIQEDHWPGRLFWKIYHNSEHHREIPSGWYFLFKFVWSLCFEKLSKDDLAGGISPLSPQVHMCSLQRAFDWGTENMAGRLWLCCSRDFSTPMMTKSEVRIYFGFANQSEVSQEVVRLWLQAMMQIQSIPVSSAQPRNFVQPLQFFLKIWQIIIASCKFPQSQQSTAQTSYMYIFFFL